MCVALFSTMTNTSTMKTVPIATTASERRSQTNETRDFTSPLRECDESRTHAVDSTDNLRFATSDGIGDDLRPVGHGLHTEFDVARDGVFMPVARRVTRGRDRGRDGVDELLDVPRLRL